MNQGELGICYMRIKREAEILAGDTMDFSRRAAVYHHLYQSSGGNHMFPLIAAHGALWAMATSNSEPGLASCFHCAISVPINAANA